MRASSVEDKYRIVVCCWKRRSEIGADSALTEVGKVDFDHVLALTLHLQGSKGTLPISITQVKQSRPSSSFCFVIPRLVEMSLLRLPSSPFLYTCCRLPRSLPTTTKRGLCSTVSRCSSSENKEVVAQTEGQHPTSTPATQDPSQRLPSHDLDYTAHIDHGTSNFSPVPRRVMDGSEPGDVLAAAVLSGAPIDLQARQVRYAPTESSGFTHWVDQALGRANTDCS